MNVGMGEAISLARTIRGVLREKAPLNRLEACDREWQGEWQRLLGLTGGLKPGKGASPWVRERCGRILPCLPASYEDLTRMAGQLGLHFS